MPVSFTFILFCVLANHALLEAFPTEDPSSKISDSHENRKHVSEEPSYTTTEVANKTGIVSSVWHKISNIFKGETTTTTEPAPRHEVLMPEEKKLFSIKKGNSSRDFRMAPMDFSRQSDEGLWQREGYDEGNLYPIHHQLRKRRSITNTSLPENEISVEEVRTRTLFRKPNKIVKFNLKTPPYSVNTKKVPMTIEEFDQGETKNGQMQRNKDIWKSADWKTEKIVVGSDPVENIDNTNYIEETKDSDFPFHAFSIKPIIVEDSFSFEITTQLQKELPPLKIIEY